MSEYPNMPDAESYGAEGMMKGKRFAPKKSKRGKGRHGKRKGRRRGGR